jgi:hypothetical protein
MIGGTFIQITLPAQMTSPAVTAAVGLYFLLCSQSVLFGSAHDGCGAAPSIWPDVHNTVCHHAVVGPRSTQTATEDPEYGGPLFHEPLPASLWCEAPFSTTDTRPAGWRRSRRHVEVESTSWLGVVGTVLGAVLGAADLHPVAAWASASALVSVGLLVTNTHFRWPVCFALSLNYWSAVVWIAWAVSVDLAVVLGLLATVLRSSVVLFFVNETVRCACCVLRVPCHPSFAFCAGFVGTNSRYIARRHRRHLV